MFVNYSHPSELKDRSKRRKVASYAAKPIRPQSNLSNKRNGPLKWRRTNLLPESPPNSNIATPLSNDVDVQTSIPSEDDTEGEIVELPEVILPPTPPLESIILGGLRSDPFNAFPIESEGLIPYAIDYYRTLYVPANDFVFSNIKDGNPMMLQHFPKALQIPVQFEAIVLLMISHSKTAFGHPDSRERLLAKHRGSVLRQLNRRLANETTRVDDVTLNVTVSLLATDYYNDNDDHVKIHLTGLRQLVALRGGAEKLDLFMRLVVLGVESMCLHALKRRGLTLDEEFSSNSNTAVTLTYPTHPFPFHTIDLVSRLPQGLQDLALTTHISCQLLELLSPYTKDINELPPAPVVRTSRTRSAAVIDDMTMALGQIAIAPHVTSLEMTLVSALLVFRATATNSRVPARYLDRIRDIRESVVQLDSDLVQPRRHQELVQDGTSSPVRRSTEEVKAIRDCVLWMTFVSCGSVPLGYEDEENIKRKGRSAWEKKKARLGLLGQILQRQERLSSMVSLPGVTADSAHFPSAASEAQQRQEPQPQRPTQYQQQDNKRRRHDDIENPSAPLSEKTRIDWDVSIFPVLNSFYWRDDIGEKWRDSFEECVALGLLTSS